MHFSFLNKFSKKNKNGNKMESSSILPKQVTQEMVNTIKFIDNISKIAISESDKHILHSVHEILLSSALQTTAAEYYRYTQGNHLFSIPLMESTNSEFEYSIDIDVESIVNNLIDTDLLKLSYISKQNFSFLGPIRYFEIKKEIYHQPLKFDFTSTYQPVIVLEIHNIAYFVIDGNHRLNSDYFLQLNYIPTYVLRADLIALYKNKIFYSAYDRVAYEQFLRITETVDIVYMNNENQY